MDSRAHSEWQRGAKYALLTGSVLLVALAGYLGYHIYPRFDLPAVTALGLLPLAAGAGIASFFSPCSFGLLVTLLARSVRSVDDNADTTSSLPLVKATLSLATGAVLFLLLIGSIVAIAGAQVFADVVFTSTEGIILRAVIGGLLILLGLIQMELIPSPLPEIERFADRYVTPDIAREGPATIGQYILFGFGYLVAGFG